MKVQAIGLFWFRDAIQYHEFKKIFTDADVRCTGNSGHYHLFFF